MEYKVAILSDRLIYWMLFVLGIFEDSGTKVRIFQINDFAFMIDDLSEMDFVIVDSNPYSSDVAFNLRKEQLTLKGINVILGEGALK